MELESGADTAVEISFEAIFAILSPIRKNAVGLSHSGISLNEQQGTLDKK